MRIAAPPVVGGTLGDGKLVDGRELRAVIDGERASADHPPDREGHRPVEKGADQRSRAPPPPFPRGARAGWGASPLRAEVAVVELVVVVEPGFPAFARHTPRLEALAAASALSFKINGAV